MKLIKQHLLYLINICLIGDNLPRSQQEKKKKESMGKKSGKNGFIIQTLKKNHRFQVIQI